MSVFDDPKKELEQLQAQLLEQEDWFERELDEAKRMIGDMPEPRKTQASAAAAPKAKRTAPADADTMPVRNYANGYGAQESKKRLKQEEDYDKDEYAPKKKGIRGLVILACLELLGIAGILGYWALFFLR